MSLAWKTFKRHHLWKTLFVVCLLLLVGSFFTDNYAFLSTGKVISSLPTGDATSYEGSGKAKLDFYVMSQCPYGVMVEDAVIPVLRKLGDAVEFNVYFIGGMQGDAFQSLHGQPEVDENMRQACIQENSPDKFLDYLECLNKDYGNAGSAWINCVEKIGIDKAVVDTCFNGEEGKTLLKASFAKAEEVGAGGSPTIYVDDVPYQSGRDSLSFQRVLCQGLQDHPECVDLPECGSAADCAAQPGKISACDSGKCAYKDAVKVGVVVLSDDDCANCDTSQIMEVSKNFFPGVVEKYVDAKSDEGKALVEKYGITVVPVFLFEKSLEDTEFWSAEPRIRVSFEETVDGYKLTDATTGASYFVSEEARLAQIEAKGVTLGDNKPQMDLFVMSQCPYGVMAEDAMTPVLDLLGDNIEFNLEFVGNDAGDGTFQSLHGQPEVDENIRQLCAEKIDPDKYWDYIVCQNNDYQNVGKNWEKCAGEVGLDADALKACAEGDDGKALLSESFARADIFGASASPAIFVEGESYVGGRSPEAFKQGLCAAFEISPEECDTQLEGEAAVADVPEGGCG